MVEMEGMDGTDRVAETTSTRSGPDWGAIGRGALAGLGVVVAVAVLSAILDHQITDFDHSGWEYPLFVLVLVAYVLAGWVGQWSAVQRGTEGMPLTIGALSGLAVLVCWLPIRVVIWAVRDESRGLFTGDDPALRPGQVFGHVVIAVGLGMLGAFLASRIARHSPRSTPG
jgi:UDP-N-acetylmuramyl pentapeptide phosphotransferase/UDP-N-acetylglucosamine-1-phosphate transferase